MIKIVSPWFIRAFREGLTGKRINATTFIPFVVIFRSKELANNARTVNHEAIHGWQMLECLWVGMWILILWFGFTGRNPFEKEAHENASNIDYLKTRKLYAWRKYT